MAFFHLITKRGETISEEAQKRLHEAAKTFDDYLAEQRSGVIKAKEEIYEDEENKK